MTNAKHLRSGTVFKIASAVLGMLVLAGCQSQPQTNAELLASQDYRYRHPIVVSEAPETLDLPIGRNTRDLHGPVTDTITAFAVDSRTKGNGNVEILVPSGSANESAVHAVTGDIRTALRRGGLSGSRISTRTYSAGDPGADAPIRLSYARMMATTSECGVWPKNIAGGVGETPDYYNYGCASQANLAAMVENPSDLITPRASTPADQVRRAVVYEKYRKGESPSGQYDEGVGTTVAE